MSLRIAVYQHFLQFFRVDSDMDAHFSQRKNKGLSTKPTFFVYKKTDSSFYREICFLHHQTIGSCQTQQMDGIEQIKGIFAARMSHFSMILPQQCPGAQRHCQIHNGLKNSRECNSPGQQRQRNPKAVIKEYHPEHSAPPLR